MRPNTVLWWIAVSQLRNAVSILLMRVQEKADVGGMIGTVQRSGIKRYSSRSPFRRRQEGNSYLRIYVTTVIIGYLPYLTLLDFERAQPPLGFFRRLPLLGIHFPRR